MPYSFQNYLNLHPLLEGVAEKIKYRRNNLASLHILDLGSELKNIYGKLDEDELSIINEFHKANGFRKLHLEVARIGSSLQILHCVFFPDPRFDLPIFGVDVVSTPEGISAAIVDLSPVSKTLPNDIKEGLENTNYPKFNKVRELPEWGRVFSPYVCFIRPFDKNEENLFLELVDKYLFILISYSANILPDPIDSALTINRYERQKFYCLQQKRNDKTRNVLSKTFSQEWADRYIDVVLFDCPNSFKVS